MTRPVPDHPLHISDETFRTLARRMTGIAADFLSGLDTAPSYPQQPILELDRLRDSIPEHGLGESAFADLAHVIGASRAPTPRFFGYVLGSGEPVAALADFLASILNQNVTAWRSAPAAVQIEQQVVHAIAEFVGCGRFTGSLCGGGSSANLMALAIAREARLPANETGARAGVVYASSEAHMSIPKAVALLGIGLRNLTLVPVDSRFQMDPSELEKRIAEDLAAGRTPLAVVASAGTVNTGAIDPLADIAAICSRYNLWLHVDGAYGVLAACVLPERFAGIEHADSVSLDPHKWLYQPVDCGMLLVKRAEGAVAAFRHSGDYAQPLEPDPVQSFCFFDQSIELSRRFRALKLWLSLRYHGLAAFRSAIRADLGHASQLADCVNEDPELELLAPPSLSVVCFRHRARANDDANAFNEAILKRVIERGRVYLSNATIRGQFALRACFVNHRTTAADVRLIVTEVTGAAADLEKH